MVVYRPEIEQYVSKIATFEAGDTFYKALHFGIHVLNIWGCTAIISKPLIYPSLEFVSGDVLPCTMVNHY